MLRIPITLLFLLLLLHYSRSQELERIKPKKVKASSYHPAGPAKNAIDGNIYTMWSAELSQVINPNHGVGEWIQFDFKEPIIIAELKINNGFWWDKDVNGRSGEGYKNYLQNNRIQDFKVTYSDGHETKHSFEDIYEKQDVKLALYKTSSLRITILSKKMGTHEISKKSPGAIAEIEFYGFRDESMAQLLELTQSRQLESDEPNNRETRVQESIFAASRLEACDRFQNWIQLMSDSIKSTEYKNCLYEGCGDQTYRQICLPFFKREIFSKTFGKSYFELTSNEIRKIQGFLERCDINPTLRFALRNPFDSQNRTAYRVRQWSEDLYELEKTLEEKLAVIENLSGYQDIKSALSAEPSYKNLRELLRYSLRYYYADSVKSYEDSKKGQVYRTDYSEWENWKNDFLSEIINYGGNSDYKKFQDDLLQSGYYHDLFPILRKAIIQKTNENIQFLRGKIKRRADSIYNQPNTAKNYSSLFNLKDEIGKRFSSSRIALTTIKFTSLPIDYRQLVDNYISEFEIRHIQYLKENKAKVLKSFDNLPIKQLKARFEDIFYMPIDSDPIFYELWEILLTSITEKIQYELSNTNSFENIGSLLDYGRAMPFTSGVLDIEQMYLSKKYAHLENIDQKLKRVRHSEERGYLYIPSEVDISDGLSDYERFVLITNGEFEELRRGILIEQKLSGNDFYLGLSRTDFNYFIVSLVNEMTKHFYSGSEFTAEGVLRNEKGTRYPYTFSWTESVRIDTRDYSGATIRSREVDRTVNHVIFVEEHVDTFFKEIVGNKRGKDDWYAGYSHYPHTLVWLLSQREPNSKIFTQFRYNWNWFILGANSFQEDNVSLPNIETKDKEYGMLKHFELTQNGPFKYIRE